MSEKFKKWKLEEFGDSNLSISNEIVYDHQQKKIETWKSTVKVQAIVLEDKDKKIAELEAKLNNIKEYATEHWIFKSVWKKMEGEIDES